MRISYFQYEPAFLRPQENLDFLRESLPGYEADVVVLPELALTGYFFTALRELEMCAEELSGPGISMLRDLSGKTGALYVIGFAEKSGSRYFNSAAAVDASGICGHYRKLHLFNTEKHFFTPGNFPLKPFLWKGRSFGLLVCFDHMFPEAARTLALQGTEVICHPSNLVLPEYAQLTSRVRALENRIFWVLANRTGKEETENGSLSFTGCSQIVDSTGAVLTSAGPDNTQWGCADIDPREAGNKHVTLLNDVFSDRRTQWYVL